MEKGKLEMGMEFLMKWGWVFIAALIILAIGIHLISQPPAKIENSAEERKNFECSGVYCDECSQLPFDVSETKEGLVCFNLWFVSTNEKNLTLSFKAGTFCCPEEILPNKTFPSFFVRKDENFMIGFKRFE